MKSCFLTKKGPRAVGPYSTAVITGNLAFVSGMVPLDPATNKLVEGGIETQAHRALDNVKLVLEEMGLTMSSVVKAGIFVTDLKDFATVNAIYREYFDGDYPARSCVQVAALPLGALIEVEVIATVEK